MKAKYQNKLFILLLTAFLVLGFVIGCQWHEMRSEPLETIDTVTVVEFKHDTDTFEVEKPIPKYVEKLRVDTFYSKEGKDTLLVNEQKTYIDTLCQNEDSILLKTTISGINARIDSLQVLLKKQEKIITNTITIEKYIDRPKKFISIQPQLGMGYGVFNKKPDMYVGIGIGVNIGR
jgi:hypothetical protein